MYNQSAADVQNAKADAKKGVRNAKGELVDAAYEVKGDLNSAAHNAGEKVRELYKNANEQLTHFKDTAIHRIEDKPLQSTAISFGIGFLVGALLRKLV